MPRRTPTDTNRRPRAPTALTRERIVGVAVDIADGEGIDALSMRRLGQELHVDPMALYHHVRDKDDLLDGMVEAVVEGIELPNSAGGWKAALRATVLSARRTMVRHPWAARVIESRPVPGPATMRYIERVLGLLRDGGFSVELGHHALHMLGSRVLGFTQDLWHDSSDVRPDPETAAAMAAAIAATYPRLGEMAKAVSHEGALGGCDDDIEFEFGLELILDGLERRRDAA